MADKEKQAEPPFGDKGIPSRAGLVVAFMGLGALVLVVDWILGGIFK